MTAATTTIGNRISVAKAELDQLSSDPVSAVLKLVDIAGVLFETKDQALGDKYLATIQDFKADRLIEIVDQIPNLLRMNHRNAQLKFLTTCVSRAVLFVDLSEIQEEQLREKDAMLQETIRSLN